MDSSRRLYRHSMQRPGFRAFTCQVKETDLYVAVDEASYGPQLEKFVERRVLYYRTSLEQLIAREPEFQTTLQPYLVAAEEPPLILAMTRAGNQVGVGPMAAVAGAIAEYVGHDLLPRVKQVIVENGGDIYFHVTEEVTVGIYAGTSPLSNRFAVAIRPQGQDFGVCTSSGTVGPSLSLGRADAAMIISPSTILADAVATAAGNRVQSAADLEQALSWACQIPGVSGVLLIKDDQLAVWGQVKIVGNN
ncbi:MAG TPA: UPF0280 family protein [Oscillospiraceae bacterium]|nr:UPF0280 family protein [Oscillospiraceae bacterium]